MINSAAIAKIERHVADAKAKGARIAVGGRTLKTRFFEPTLLTEATRDMLFASEETFGPVAPLFRFRTEEEAIEIANDSPMVWRPIFTRATSQDASGLPTHLRLA
jgi:succinate-semialdehyde dehydrogenase / glutarate-semialdehyde dehydrogenase